MVTPMVVSVDTPSEAIQGHAHIRVGVYLQIGREKDRQISRQPPELLPYLDPTEHST